MNLCQRGFATHVFFPSCKCWIYFLYLCKKYMYIMNSRLDSKQLFTQVEVNSAGYLLSLERWGQLPHPLFTDTGPLRWRIVLVPNQWIGSDKQKKIIWSKLSWKVITHTCPFCFTNQWISQDILSLSSQSECVKMDIFTGLG